MWSCTWSNKRVKSGYCARARLSTDQDNLWREQPVRVLGLPPARWLRLLAAPILLASAPPGLEAQVCGPWSRIVLCCARALKLT